MYYPLIFIRCYYLVSNRKLIFSFFYFKLLFFVSVCHLLRSGVAALFGPQSGTTSSHVQSICDAMEIPHIETRWDYRLKRDDYSVNLYPHPTAISKVRRRHLVAKMINNYLGISESLFLGF